MLETGNLEYELQVVFSLNCCLCTNCSYILLISFVCEDESVLLKSTAVVYIVGELCL